MTLNIKAKYIVQNVPTAVIQAVPLIRTKLVTSEIGNNNSATFRDSNCFAINFMINMLILSI